MAIPILGDFAFVKFCNHRMAPPPISPCRRSDVLQKKDFAYIRVMVRLWLRQTHPQLNVAPPTSNTQHSMMSLPRQLNDTATFTYLVQTNDSMKNHLWVLWGSNLTLSAPFCFFDSKWNKSMSLLSTDFCPFLLLRPSFNCCGSTDYCALPFALLF